MKYIIFTDFFIAFNLFILFAIFCFRKSSSNKILASMVFMALFTSLNSGFMYVPGYYRFISFNFLGAFIATFFGPLMLIYINTIVGKEYRFQKKHLWHTLPALPALYFCIVFLFYSDAEKAVEFDLVKQSNSLATNIVYSILLLQSASYLVVAKIRVNKLKKTKEEGNRINQLHIEWLNFFVNQNILINIILVLGFTIQSIVWPNYNYVSELIISPLSAFIFYLVISYKSYSYHSIFDQNNFYLLLEEHQKSMGISVDTEKENIKIIDDNTQQQLELIKSQLDTLLNEKKIFTDPNLTLQKLAEETKSNKNVLSLTINSLYQKSFYELINGYRVEEAKKLLLSKENKHYKIESIGEMAGFNSRATFFAVFKKMCDMTPFQFQKMQEEDREKA